MPLTDGDNNDDRSSLFALVVFALVLTVFLIIAEIADRIGLWPPWLGFDGCHGFYDKTKGLPIHHPPMIGYDQFGCSLILIAPSSDHPNFGKGQVGEQFQKRSVPSSGLTHAAS